LKVGNGEDCIPRNGRWNFNKQLFTPIRIEQWEVVNFSAHCDTSHLSRELINCGRNKGLQILTLYLLNGKLRDDESEEEFEFQLTCDFLHIIVLMVLVPLPDIIYG
ncbi:Protein argonaute 16, partial [Camellia lanceoleosa]